MSKKTDALQNFIFEHADIRGELVHLRDTYQTIIQQRTYPLAVQKLLGEALVSCVLLVGSIKFEGEIQLQFKGDERLPLIIVQCNHLLQIRACATYKELLSEDDYYNAFINGTMGLQIKQDQNIYNSILPIRSTSMSDNLSHYFAQSEQISTHICLAVDEYAASGMMLQLLPTNDTQQREQFWEYAVAIGETLKPQELLTLDNETILHRLYHETEIRLFDERIVMFKCRCSFEKMQQALSVLGDQDLLALLEEHNKIEVKCDFCNHSYCFDEIDIRSR